MQSSYFKANIPYKEILTGKFHFLCNDDPGCHKKQCLTSILIIVLLPIPFIILQPSKSYNEKIK